MCKNYEIRRKKGTNYFHSKTKMCIFALKYINIEDHDKKPKCKL